MIRSRVTSNAFRSIAYDHTSRTLEVEFNNGRRYAYSGVPMGTHYNLVNADSTGDFFHKNVKGRFKSQEIPASKDTKGAYEEPE